MTKKEAPTIVVRAAKAEDTSNIYRLMKAEADVLKRDLNPSSAIYFIAQVLEHGYIAVADLSGRVVAAAICPSDEVALEMRGLFTLKGFEESGADVALFAHCIKKARDAGKQLMMIAPVSKETVRMVDVGQELGMVVTSQTFMTKANG